MHTCTPGPTRRHGRRYAAASRTKGSSSSTDEQRQKKGDPMSTVLKSIPVSDARHEALRIDGQRCTAIKRMLVHEAVADRFTELVVE
ncbi:aldehyde dehydrogenase family protein, partial [Burkholderia multivorans]